jgi:glycosyltransferase involved in cell wall biosynthesis
MVTISLCMIVKNEESVIARCLNSVKDIVDEIIIIDTGSTDNTKEIVKGFTNKIYDFNWINDFSAARNYSYSKATMDFILWLDADDVVLKEDRIKFKHLKQNFDLMVDIVMMKYNVGFDAQGKATFSYFRERLSKRSGNYSWFEPVHEYLQLSGKIINVDICITHKKIYTAVPGRNLDIYKKIVSQGKELTPRGLYYFARELKDNGRYDDAIVYFNKFLDSEKGWLEDNITACSELAKCYSVNNDSKNSLKVMLRSLEYDTPRAELCCQIGYYYKNKENYDQALFWFELATKLKKPENGWGFVDHDSWGYTPCIELSVCYDKLGNIEEAIKYNNKAAEYKQDDPSVLYNKKYFEELQKCKPNTSFVILHSKWQNRNYSG